MKNESQKNKNGNMYDFTETWNPLHGECEHGCIYCYVNMWKKRMAIHREYYSCEPRIFEKAMNKTFRKGQTVFVVSMNDLFAEKVPSEMIIRIIEKTKQFPETRFFLQTKNPKRLLDFQHLLPENSVICTTIESDTYFLDVYKECKVMMPSDRLHYFAQVSDKFEKHITIEPIMKIRDVEKFANELIQCKPNQINIGANSKRKQIVLKEPKLNDVSKLIEILGLNGITVYEKTNLKYIKI